MDGRLAFLQVSIAYTRMNFETFERLGSLAWQITLDELVFWIHLQGLDGNVQLGDQQVELPQTDCSSRVQALRTFLKEQLGSQEFNECDPEVTLVQALS